MRASTRNITKQWCGRVVSFVNINITAIDPRCRAFRGLVNYVGIRIRFGQLASAMDGGNFAVDFGRVKYKSVVAVIRCTTVQGRSAKFQTRCRRDPFHKASGLERCLTECQTRKALLSREAALARDDSKSDH